MADVHIPTLCDHPDLVPVGNCRLCVVEQKNQPILLASCTTRAENGMDIDTNTQRVREARRVVLELLLAEHRADCISCSASAISFRPKSASARSRTAKSWIVPTRFTVALLVRTRGARPRRNSLGYRGSPVRTMSSEAGPNPPGMPTNSGRAGARSAA